MTSREWISGIVLAASLCVTAATTASAQGAVQGPFNFTNNTVVFANDFHATFTGSGGTLNRPRMTKGPNGATITVAPDGNAIDIIFPNAVPPGGQIGFTVRSRFPIRFYAGNWTWFGFPLWPAAVTDPRSIKKKSKG